MSFGFKYTSDWLYETSEDVTVSIIASVSFGTLVLKNKLTAAKMKIKYRCLAIGNGKGLPVNFSRSSFDNPSGPVGEVTSDRHFDDFQFPCRGYILGAGGGGLITDGSGTPNTAGATIVLFGLAPVFAGFRAWGTGGALLPGVGVSAGVAAFSID